MNFPPDHAPTGRDAARPRWALFRKQFDLVRVDDGRVYLTRWWIVAVPFGGIVLHKMNAPDARTTVHDHPFGFVSIVLRGGYVETSRHPRTLELQERRIRRVNVMGKRRAHAITKLLRVPTWTLLLVGRQSATWGFWIDSVDFPKQGFWRWVRHDHFDSGHYVP